MAAFCAQAAVLHVDSCLMAHNFVQRNHDNEPYLEVSRRGQEMNLD